MSINLTKHPANEFHPDWSLDGTTDCLCRPIAKKTKMGSANWEIFVMNADGTNQVNISRHPENDYRPDWSPDGAQIAFVAYREDKPEVYVMNADGTSQANITKHPATDGDPDWSPSGKQIVFASERERNSEIYVMNADGTAQINLTNNPGDDFLPAWSSRR